MEFTLRGSIQESDCFLAADFDPPGIIFERGTLRKEKYIPNRA